MIHTPVVPPGRTRVPAHLAMLVALAVRCLPGRCRMRVRIALVRSTRWLPPADHQHVRRLYQTVIACQPRWWRGQIDCKERALATVLASALTGRRCRMVLGARTLPSGFHAWVTTTDGNAIGSDEAGGADHPWTAVYTSP
ncbi:lasso peptide biosynthesis B2 protein [Streptomyces sp. BP-8]|uniref:Lasso peptide biosynthesis B2 protein n=1 Tax=Streptomyces sirii TaxID=3127701 RepID=A0ABZ2R2C9_9ACTN